MLFIKNLVAVRWAGKQLAQGHHCLRTSLSMRGGKTSPPGTSPPCIHEGLS